LLHSERRAHADRRFIIAFRSADLTTCPSQPPKTNPRPRLYSPISCPGATQDLPESESFFPGTCDQRRQARRRPGPILGRSQRYRSSLAWPSSTCPPKRCRHSAGSEEGDAFNRSGGFRLWPTGRPQPVPPPSMASVADVIARNSPQAIPVPVAPQSRRNHHPIKSSIVCK